ncbi:glycoside hydrolase family 3 C-terminal domain-containing protein [Actinoallomurus sp. NBC_01490]|uniref:glycoside hydrolase family 3 C-terminal domain-containing protein n=1 Tax=Actinoallomurus sp. NBC_01490 TaxID=2903557 RepID=UPI002E375E8D|nr:glycoside hydrolase family 3 C-terminal domain-containing protein [Actinoallomurus sp. NBC_01490]
MYRKPFALIAAGAALCCAAATGMPSASAQETAPTNAIYLNPAYSSAERAADLVGRLTLTEKAQQMNSNIAPAIPRLGVAQWGWWNEASHGVAAITTSTSNPPPATNTTSYPVDLAMGSTWNPDLVHKVASAIGDEAREVMPNNTENLDFYSPTVNLGRDPRWGRNDETWSEDPTLTAALAGQYVNGLQGQDENGKLPPSANGYLKAVATLKHFAANNSEYNRRTGTSDMDQRTLREYYTAQFRDIIESSHPGSIMSSYNRVNGVPAAASVQLMDTLARQTWGFGGYFTSDCDAVYEIQGGHHWQPPGASAPLDQYGRTAYAITAGEDLDCNGGYHDASNYGNTVPDAVAKHITTQTGVFNENDVDVALVRLFTARIQTGEFDQEDQVPWVRDARARLGGTAWVNSDDNKAVTQTPERIALAQQAAEQSLVLLKNAPAAGAKDDLLPLKVPAQGSYKVAVMGAYANQSPLFLGGYATYEGPSGAAKQVNPYQGIKAAIQKINPKATVDYYPGVTGSTLNTVDSASVAAADQYDVVIVVAGTNSSNSREDVDRTTLALPGAQASLISQVAARNPHTVAYMETVGQVDTNGFQSQVPAMLWSSYNGQEQGAALADVLLGKTDPSGRLPFTWYADQNQIPAIGDYNVRPTSTTHGRTYMYFNGDVAYPFGYGLSYTPFSYSALNVEKKVDANGTVQATVKVTNNGDARGTTVPQLYVSTPFEPVSKERPAQRLEAFDKVTVDPHRSKTVRLTFPASKLAFFDESSNRYVVDPGTYELRVGSSSGDVAAKADVRVDGTLKPSPAVVTAKPAQAGDAAQGIVQRVTFDKGTTIDPQLTVSMKDESSYGYVTKGQSTPLPAGVHVSYRSDNPKVVRIVGDRVIRTVGSGVATVTATVHSNGGSASTTFVVRVP